MKYVASFVKMKRKELGLTQVDITKRAGVGLRFIRELEAGKESLRCSTINQVLALFGARLGVEVRKENSYETYVI